MDLEDQNKYVSALSVYHSAECVFPEEEMSKFRIESKDLLPIDLESSEIDQNSNKNLENGFDKPEKTKNVNFYHFTEKNPEIYDYFKIRKINLWTPLIALVLYILDVLSDQILALRYFLKGQIIFGTLTLMFVILPSIYISVFVGKTWRKLVSRGPKFYILILPLVFFNLEPAVQYVKNFLTVRKYLEVRKSKNFKNEKKYFDKYINGNRNVSDLKYSESLMEALPQFMLQTYIILTNYDNLTVNFTAFLQIGSLTTSVIGLFIIIFVRHKIWLLAHGFKITEFGRSLWTFGRFFSLVSRVLAITISASLYTGYTFILIGIHLIAAIIWRYITDLKTLGYIEPIFQGAADTLVARVDTLTSNLISNTLIFIENIIMMSIWFSFTNITSTELKISLIATVSLTSLLGSISDILYKRYNKYFVSKIEN